MTAETSTTETCEPVLDESEFWKVDTDDGPYYLWIGANQCSVMHGVDLSKQEFTLTPDEENNYQRPTERWQHNLGFGEYIVDAPWADRNVNQNCSIIQLPSPEYLNTRRGRLYGMHPRDGYPEFVEERPADPLKSTPFLQYLHRLGKWGQVIMEAEGYLNFDHDRYAHDHLESWVGNGPRQFSHIRRVADTANTVVHAALQTTFNDYALNEDTPLGRSIAQIAKSVDKFTSLGIMKRPPQIQESVLFPTILAWSQRRPLDTSGFDSSAAAWYQESMFDAKIIMPWFSNHNPLTYEEFAAEAQLIVDDNNEHRQQLNAVPYLP